MPLRFLTPAFELFGATLAVVLMAATSALDTISSETIWDKSQLRMYCIIGAVGGAILAIALFPPNEGGNSIRRLAVKFISSGISGLLFTPMIMRWWHLKVDVDTLLATSGGVALIAVSAIHLLVPFVLGKLGASIKQNESNSS